LHEVLGGRPQEGDVTISSELKVGLLLLATSILMALIHPRWDLLMFLVNWFVCFVAVVMVVTGAGAVMALCHKPFLGAGARFSAFSAESTFYAATTTFVAAILYAALTWFGPLAGR
jgi:hypothetical protein